MRVSLKIRVARGKQAMRRAYKQAQKLAFAVVVVEFVLVGGYAIAESKGLFEVFQSRTVIIEGAKASTTKAEAPKSPAKVAESSEAIADTIYLLESSRGKNDNKCESLGKHNGYGFRQGASRNYCTTSDNETRKLVIEWIKEKQSQGLTENQLLCLYNTGTASEQCEYIAKI
jgi:hypothetical protein